MLLFRGDRHNSHALLTSQWFIKFPKALEQRFAGQAQGTSSQINEALTLCLTPAPIRALPAAYPILHWHVSLTLLVSCLLRLQLAQTMRLRQRQGMQYVLHLLIVRHVLLLPFSWTPFGTQEPALPLLLTAASAQWSDVLLQKLES